MKKADNTTYNVSFHYSRQSEEGMNDKMCIVKIMSSKFIKCQVK